MARLEYIALGDGSFLMVRVRILNVASEDKCLSAEWWDAKKLSGSPHDLDHQSVDMLDLATQLARQSANGGVYFLPCLGQLRGLVGATQGRAEWLAVDVWSLCPLHFFPCFGQKSKGSFDVHRVIGSWGPNASTAPRTRLVRR